MNIEVKLLGALMSMHTDHAALSINIAREDCGLGNDIILCLVKPRYFMYYLIKRPYSNMRSPDAASYTITFTKWNLEITLSCDITGIMGDGSQLCHNNRSSLAIFECQPEDRTILAQDMVCYWKTN